MEGLTINVKFNYRDSFVREDHHVAIDSTGGHGFSSQSLWKAGSLRKRFQQIPIGIKEEAEIISQNQIDVHWCPLAV
jgi:hypothetical protein